MRDEIPCLVVVLFVYLFVVDIEEDFVGCLEERTSVDTTAG